MDLTISREDALLLLKKFNSDPFHLRHACTVEGVMRYFANTPGYASVKELQGYGA